MASPIEGNVFGFGDQKFQDTSAIDESIKKINRIFEILGVTAESSQVISVKKEDFLVGLPAKILETTVFVENILHNKVEHSDERDGLIEKCADIIQMADEVVKAPSMVGEQGLGQEFNNLIRQVDALLFSKSHTMASKRRHGEESSTVPTEPQKKIAKTGAHPTFPERSADIPSLVGADNDFSIEQAAQHIRSQERPIEAPEALSLPVEERPLTVFDLFKTFILNDSFLELEKLLQTTEITENFARTLLQVISDSMKCPPNPILEIILKKTALKYKDIEINLAKTSDNIVLMSSIMPLIPHDIQNVVFRRVVVNLLERGKFEEAEIFALHSKAYAPTAAKREARPSAFKGYKDTLSYLSAYSYWSLTSHKIQERFEGVSRGDIEIFLEKIKTEVLPLLVEGKNVEKIKQLKKAGANLISANKTINYGEIANWLLSRQLPLRLARYPEFLQFIQDTHIYSIAKFYKHPIGLIDNDGPGILVNGSLMHFETFCTLFYVREGKIDPEIIERTTGRRWSYLENGLVPHDPEQEIGPFKKEQPEGTFKLSFVFMNEGHTNSLSGIRRFSRHAWIQMKKPDGDVTSIGHLGAGIIRSPDIFEYLPGKRKKISFIMSESKFNAVLQEIEKEQKEHKDVFNYLSNNCSSFSGRIASFMFEKELSPKGDLKLYNTLENRIKMYIVANEITMAIFKLAPLIDSNLMTVGKLKKMFLELINRQDELAGHHDLNLEYIVSLFTKEGGMFDLLFDEVMDCVKKNERSKLVNKFYNLFTECFSCVENLSIDLPPVLAHKLEKLPKATVKNE